MCSRISKRVSVHLHDILLLQGWQLLITTCQECFKSVVKGQQQPQHHTSVQMQSGHAPDSSASLMTAAAAIGSHTSVQLHATKVVAELVANISRGELAPNKYSNIPSSTCRHVWSCTACVCHFQEICTVMSDLLLCVHLADLFFSCRIVTIPAQQLCYYKSTITRVLVSRIRTLKQIAGPRSAPLSAHFFGMVHDFALEVLQGTTPPPLVSP